MAVVRYRMSRVVLVTVNSSLLTYMLLCFYTRRSSYWLNILVIGPIDDFPVSPTVRNRNSDRLHHVPSPTVL